MSDRNFADRVTLIPKTDTHDLLACCGKQGQGALVGARFDGERPRAEIQPIVFGRQLPVRAVQHGKTLTSANQEAGWKLPERHVYRRVGPTRLFWPGQPKISHSINAIRLSDSQISSEPTELSGLAYPDDASGDLEFKLLILTSGQLDQLKVKLLGCR